MGGTVDDHGRAVDMQQVERSRKVAHRHFVRGETAADDVERNAAPGRDDGRRQGVGDLERRRALQGERQIAHADDGGVRAVRADTQLVVLEPCGQTAAVKVVTDEGGVATEPEEQTTRVTGKIVPGDGEVVTVHRRETAGVHRLFQPTQRGHRDAGVVVQQAGAVVAAEVRHHGGGIGVRRQANRVDRAPGEFLEGEVQRSVAQQLEAALPR